jgi:ribosomal-protein-alanine N-acetyltransferase
VIKIRTFAPEDIFKIIKLASITLTEQYNPGLFSYFYETFKKGFIVAEFNTEIIGFILGIKINYKVAKILMFAVSPLYRKKRIGSELLNEFKKRMIEEKIKYIELEVKTDNIKAINFYQRNGFYIINKLNNFYQNNESAYTMKLKI